MNKLLLVDDEESVVVGMRRYFRACGFAVDTAGGRVAAEALLTRQTYDAIVVDLGLTAGHGPDGLEVVLLARQVCPAARIVVLTAFGSAEIEAEARRRGADVFLQKPRPLPDVRSAIEAPTER